MNDPRVLGRFRPGKFDQRCGDRGPQFRQAMSQAPCCSDRCKDIATVKGERYGVSPPFGIVEFHGPDPWFSLHDQRQQTIVGADEAIGADFSSDGSPCRTDSRINDCDMDRSRGKRADRLVQGQCPLQDLLGWDGMRHIDDHRVGIDPKNDPFHLPDISVL